MPLYTVIMAYQGGTYIRQIVADTPDGALDVWARQPDKDMLAAIGSKRRSAWARDLISDLERGDTVATPINGTQSVWCAYFLQGKSGALLNVIQTDTCSQADLRTSERKTLHVVFGLSAAGSLREALKSTGRPDKVVGFIDDLSHGPIDATDILVRQRFTEHVLGYDFEDDEDRKKRWAFWRKSLDASRRRIVWLSRWSTLEYCNFLAWLERNGDAPFELVDLTDTCLPGWNDPSLLLPVQCTSLVGSQQFVEHQLWASATIPSPDRVLEWKALWTRLRTEDAPLRVIEPEGLVSAPLSYFDEDLKSRIGAEWVNASLVVGQVMGAMMFDSFREGGVYQCGDMVLFSRLRTLVEQGLLEKKGRLTGARFQVRRPG